MRLDDVDWPFTDSDAVISRALCLFFIAYCGVDAVCGALFYPANVNIGYQHHGFYALLLAYLLYAGHETLFALGAVEEVPTLIKSIFELRGDVRPRLSVGISIFVFRISWHLYATYVAIARQNAWLYFVSIGLLLQHISWFRQWFFSRVSRVREQDDARASGTASAAATTKRLKLEVETHVYLVALLFLLQAAFHAAVVVAEVRDTLLPRADWTQRNWAMAKLFGMLVAHVITFALTALRMAKILEDIYSEHFISEQHATSSTLTLTPSLAPLSRHLPRPHPLHHPNPEPNPTPPP